MGLKVSLLGPFVALLDGEPLTSFRSNKTQALLIYLATEVALEQSRRPYSREHLMELLWPGLPQSSAQVNLRQTLYQLRRMIPAVDAANEDALVPLVESDRNKIQLHPQALVDVDVADFLTNTGRHADANALAQAIVLYRGDFLSDFYLPDSESLEAWAAARREALRQLALDALERLAGHFLQRSEYGEAERYARQQLEIDNLRESAHRQLMEVLAQSGRRRAALSHYESVRQLLQAELNVTPSTATQTLYEAIRAGEIEVDRQPPVAESQPSPHNLPPQITPFVGRQSELRALGQHLTAPGTRLITILGPGRDWQDTSGAGGGRSATE